MLFNVIKNIGYSKSLNLLLLTYHHIINVFYYLIILTMKISQKFINLTITNANKSPMEVKYDAVLVYNRKPVSVGYNTYRHIFHFIKINVLCFM